MDIKERILQILKIKGPIIPVQLSRELGMDSLMVSAHLSELSSNNKLKISSIKIGGSPLYYLQDQKHALTRFISHLNEKDLKVFHQLEQKKIMRDKTSEPIVRVALRNIKDFAIPLEVNVGGEKELFWKYFLLPKADVESMIKGQLGLNKQPEKKHEKKIQSTPKPEPVQKEIKKPVVVQKKPVEKQQTIKKPEDKQLTEIKSDDQFLAKINNYFQKNNIEVLEQKIIRKKTEIDFIINVPSTVGALKYFCKAKSKKKFNDGDLSSAYLQGQSRKLPVLFIATGDLTKKAKSMIGNEFNLKFKKIQ